MTQKYPQKLADLKNSNAQVLIVGAGLAGCECAWQLVQRGISVALIEQRPHKNQKLIKQDFLQNLSAVTALKVQTQRALLNFLKVNSIL